MHVEILPLYLIHNGSAIGKNCPQQTFILCMITDNYIDGNRRVHTQCILNSRVSLVICENDVLREGNGFVAFEGYFA